MNIFKGIETGAKRDMLVLNSGAALYTAGKSENIAVGVEIASEIIKCGAAMDKLQEYAELSRRMMEVAV